MKQALLLTVVLAGLFFIGCGSTPARVDKGAVKARTFSFINGGVPMAAEFADKREAIHKTIQDAITQNLAGKGVSS